jgi:hypothetical protein
MEFCGFAICRAQGVYSRLSCLDTCFHEYVRYCPKAGRLIASGA